MAGVRLLSSLSFPCRGKGAFPPPSHAKGGANANAREARVPQAREAATSVQYTPRKPAS